MGRSVYKVRPSDLSAAVREILDEEAEGLGEAVEAAVADTCGGLADDLQSRSARLFGSGEYARGWTKSVNRNGLHSAGTVYNAGPHAWLSPMLENGHAVWVNAGSPPGNRAVPTGKRTPAKRHIEPAWGDALRDFDGRLKRDV